MYTHLGKCKNDKIKNFKNISHLLRIVLISYFHKCIKVKWVFRKYIWISVKIKYSKVLMLKYTRKILEIIQNSNICLCICTYVFTYTW
jgi:SET domain-containing protein